MKNNMDSRGNILVVDDNPDNLKLAVNILTEHGYQVRPVPNGRLALSGAKAIPPDLILLDIMMPEMDGFEVCEKLKKEEITKEIPIIFLTARVDTEDIVKGFDMGGADYVCKPFQAAELLARIKTHIGFKKAREEIRTLQGLIPICAQCKKVRDDEGIWNQIESYIEHRSDVLFSHGFCPECFEELYPKQYQKLKDSGKI